MAWLLQGPAAVAEAAGTAKLIFFYQMVYYFASDKSAANAYKNAGAHFFCFLPFLSLFFLGFDIWALSAFVVMRRVAMMIMVSTILAVVMAAVCIGSAGMPKRNG